MQIDSNIHKKLSDSEKEEFEIWNELLESRGYEALVQFLSGQYESLHAVIQNPNSWDEHLYARGHRDGLNLVLNLEAILEARIQELSVEEDVEEFERSLEL